MYSYLAIIFVNKNIIFVVILSIVLIVTNGLRYIIGQT